MNLISTVLLAASLSADAFAVAVAKGLRLRRPRLSEALRTGLVFGAIEASTPVIGWFLGRAASGYIESIDHWVAFFLLGGIGSKMIYESFQSQDNDKAKPRKNSLLVLMVSAIGSSIDALAVGVTIAFIDADIWLLAAATGFMTFTMATIGIMVGHSIGARAGRIAEAIGGLVLIVLGTGILLEHTGVI